MKCDLELETLRQCYLLIYLLTVALFEPCELGRFLVSVSACLNVFFSSLIRYLFMLWPMGTNLSKISEGGGQQWRCQAQYEAPRTLRRTTSSSGLGW